MSFKPHMLKEIISIYILVLFAYEALFGITLKKKKKKKALFEIGPCID